MTNYTDYIIAGLSLIGALFVLLAAVGIYRMPDTFLRISVTTKATTLGVGLILIALAVFLMKIQYLFGLLPLCYSLCLPLQ